MTFEGCPALKVVAAANGKIACTNVQASGNAIDSEKKEEKKEASEEDSDATKFVQGESELLDEEAHCQGSAD